MITNEGIAAAPKLAELVIKPIAAGTIAVGIRCGVNQIVSGKIGAKAIPIKGKLIN
jgi:hypothetical protein